MYPKNVQRDNFVKWEIKRTMDLPSDRLSTPPHPIELRVPEELSDVRRCIYIVERYNGALYNS